MHELSIAQSLLSIILETVEIYEKVIVLRIGIKIGILANILPNLLRFFFDIIKVGTVADKAILFFELVPISIFCYSCRGLIYTEELIFNCLYCDSSSIGVIKGNELIVEYIEIKEI